LLCCSSCSAHLETNLASIGLRFDDPAGKRAALEEKGDGQNLHGSRPDDRAALGFNLLCDYSLHM
jgi:hypothetical protein